MKLSKKEALLLAKVLHTVDDRLRIPLTWIMDRIDNFLEGDDHEEATDHVRAEEAVAGPADAEGAGKVVEAEDDEDEEVDGIVHGNDLHNLKPMRSSKHCALEFESTRSVESAGRVDLIVDGLIEVQDINRVRRAPGKLYVRDSDMKWHCYPYGKAVASWARVLPLGENLEVVSE